MSYHKNKTKYTSFIVRGAITERDLSVLEDVCAAILPRLEVVRAKDKLGGVGERIAKELLVADKIPDA
eukprot:gene23153-biopygen8458